MACNCVSQALTNQDDSMVQSQRLQQGLDGAEWIKRWKSVPGVLKMSQKEGKRERQIVGIEIGSGSDLNCYKTL